MRKDLLGLCAAAALLCALLAFVAGARAADSGSLEAKLSAAREEASSIAAGLRASNERLAVAQSEAAAAEAHEDRLSGLLAEGEVRTAALSARVTETRRRLAAEKARLHRSRVPVKIAQEQRGHASIQTTLDIYTHVVDASQRMAVEQLEERLFGEMDCFGLKSPATVDRSQPASAGVH